MAKKKAKKVVKKAKPKAKKAAPKRKPAAKKIRPAKAPRAAASAQPPVLPWRQPEVGEGKLGIVDDYFGHIGVIALTLEKPLALGQHIHVHGHTSNFVQAVDSIQIGHQSVTEAKAGDSVGIKVGEKARKGDYVFLHP